MEKEKKQYESKTKNINNMLHKDQGIQYNPQLKSIFILPHGLPHAWFSFLGVNNTSKFFIPISFVVDRYINYKHYLWRRLGVGRGQNYTYAC